MLTWYDLASVVRDAVLKCGASTGEPFGVFLDWLGVHDCTVIIHQPTPQPIPYTGSFFRFVSISL